MILHAMDMDAEEAGVRSVEDDVMVRFGGEVPFVRWLGFKMAMTGFYTFVFDLSFMLLYAVNRQVLLRCSRP